MSDDTGLACCTAPVYARDSDTPSSFLTRLVVGTCSCPNGMKEYFGSAPGVGSAALQAFYSLIHACACMLEWRETAVMEM